MALPIKYGRHVAPQLNNAQYMALVQAAKNELALNSQTILKNAVQQASVAMAWDVVSMTNQAILMQTGSIARSLEAFAEALQHGMSYKLGKTELLRMWTEIGEGAREAVIAEYQAKHGMSTPYRWQDPKNFKRYSGGKMMKALKGPGLMKIGPDGIVYLIPSILDRDARQWYRLNFGARPAGKWSKPPQYSMTFFGKSLGKGPSLDNFAPSKAFFLPQGIWSNELVARTTSLKVPTSKQPWHHPSGKAEFGGGVAFYPKALLKNWPTGWDDTSRKATKGIAGTGFLDAGPAWINKTLPVALEALVIAWFEEAKTDARAPLRSQVGLTERQVRGRSNAIRDLFDEQAKTVATRYRNQVRAASLKRSLGIPTPPAQYAKFRTGFRI